MSPPLSPEAAWDDLSQAADFAERRFEEWANRALLDAPQVRAVLDGYGQRRSGWSERRTRGETPPARTGLPPAGPDEPPALRSLRYWAFLANDLRKLRDDGQLRRPQADGLLAEVRERQDALTRRLPADALPEALPADDGPAPAGTPRVPPPPLPTPRGPRKPLLEILLDPRNIQWLLAFGGALMFVGVVILLWINKVFTPPVLAGVLCVSNAAVLLGGWALLRLTKYQMAGKALTLLACLVMPLNLWYLQAHDMLTVENHLWVPAVACCALLAVSAWIVRDETFVYVLVAGVASAGLLGIASIQPVTKLFWEIVAPSSLLVALGLVCIHAERAFADEDGPFGRKRFGLAFFWSGHAALAAGLLLILGAFISGKWAYPAFAHLYAQRGVGPSAIVTTHHWLALVLVLAAAYAYLYSDLVVRHVGIYIHAAALTLLWGLVLGFEQLNIPLTMDLVIGLLAGLALAINLAQARITGSTVYTRALPILGVLLPMLAVLLGVVEFAKGTGQGAGYLVAMALTVVSCRVGAYLYRTTAPSLAAVYFFATGAATLVGAVSLLNFASMTRWSDIAPLVMLLPIAYAVASGLYRDAPESKPLMWVGHAATLVILLSCLLLAAEGSGLVTGQKLNLTLAVLALEAAAFYTLTAVLHRQPAGVYLAAVMACGGVWQLFTYFAVAPEYYVLTFAVVGFVVLTGYRFAFLEGALGGPLTDAAYAASNTLLSLSFVSSALMTLSRLSTGRELQTSLIWLSLVLTGISLLTVILTRQRAWRRWYVVTTVGLGLLTFLVVMNASGLSGLQKLQLFCVAAGAVLLVISHIGWYREQERDDDLVSTGLFVGSLLVGWPMAIAALVDRASNSPNLLNEIGLLVIALVLFTSGVLFQIRATTINGAILGAVYVVSLLLFIPWHKLDTIALVITIGGGVLFTLGLVLSVFREQLLRMPEQIKERQGVFRVLSWR